MRLVIVGAGFSGAVTAIEYLKRANAYDELIIINKTGKMAKGLAYGTNSPHHHLNVPAGNMSALVNFPDSFVEYCKLQQHDIDGKAFVARKIYGEYLETLLATAEQEGETKTTRLVAEVVRLEYRDSKVILTLDNGQLLIADHVVLSFGNFPPMVPKPLFEFRDSGIFLNDPWALIGHRCAARAPRVLIIGNGLTAVDATLNINTQFPEASFTLLSRRGLTPQAHRERLPTTPYTGTIGSQLLASKPTIKEYIKLLRKEVSLTPDRWRDVISSLRPITSMLWEKLNTEERRRFLRHVQPYWDIHRHRLAPQSAKSFQNLIDTHRIRILQARITKAAQQGQRIVIDAKERNTQKVSTLEFDFVVNCTGPCTDLHAINSQLIKALLRDGTIAPDSLKLGILTDSEYETINVRGESNTWLSYIGPMLRASYWEATAVPDLRRHAYDLVTKLVHPRIMSSSVE
jgi:uncharacterized NAD(P)/FAD-binding protein YdhS